MSGGKNNKGLIALAILGAAAVIALLAWWWYHNYKRVERIVPMPPRGEASYNPLYALKLALRNEGVKVDARQRLQLDQSPHGQSRLGRHDTLVLYNDPRTLPTVDVDALLEWVSDGGHLLLRMPPEERFGSEIRPGQLLWNLKLRPMPDESACMPLGAGQAEDDSEAESEDDVETETETETAAEPEAGSKAEAEAAAEAAAKAANKAARVASPMLFCGSARFTMEGVEPLLSWGDLDAGYVYARLAHGDGTIDVLSDLDFLNNNELEHPAKLALARQLLQPGWKQGTVHLIYAASMPPLWRLLLERAWMVWVPLLLAVFAWLWMRKQRFGPLRPTPEPGRRALLEHVQASGEHLWRYGRAHVLHQAMRDAFFARLRRRDPLAAALDGPAQAQAIAEHTGMPVADVVHALQTPRPSDGADFRLRIARLIQMRQKL